ncbi:Bidirectional sugar transporter SWEET3 [Hibiscus syriacus]|uniref:Bidirectional sugar transporter SWEET3 n=1 Tax=Hibiscus syriacus TaxID=106335 RepID=A0A6A3D6W1_HIBSY|nr:Bidirectional sugar transporter SWEET3 [Hibiscus syriacus]
MQLDIFEGDKEKKHRGILMHSVHRCTLELSPLHLIKAGGITTIVIVIFSVTALISTFLFHDHHHRKVLVGTIGLVASVAMYAAPLVVVKRVIVTKSVEFMPFYLSFFSFMASVLWLAYGLLSHDLLLASPNLVGLPLGLLQLGLYCKYRKREIIEEEPCKWDLEQNNNQEKPKHMQLVTNENINGKC